MSDRDSEAAHWFARLRGTYSDADRTAFEAWQADPENAKAYVRAEEDWLLTAGVAPAHLVAHRKAAHTPVPRGNNARWALAAGLLLAVSLAGTWILRGNHGSGPILAGNEIGALRLDDGTRVALMDGARIEQKYTASERRILLVGGRARFTVAHDGARPFRVEAGGSETTALGTIFEVDLTKGQPRIHLVQGSVEVRTPAASQTRLRLRPGQRATIKDDAPVLFEATPEAETMSMASPVGEAGKPSLLLADGLPLGAVIDRANRVNSAGIELADSAIGGRLVSGRFDVSNAKALARQLAVALDLDVQERAGGYVLIPKKTN